MKLIKRLFILITCFTILMANPITSKAFSLSDIITGGDSFLEDANSKQVFNEENEESAIGSMYWLMIGIAIAAALIYGMILGIQFITSGVTGQADVKKKVIPYVIGCVVAFGAFGIWRIVYTILNSTPVGGK